MKKGELGKQTCVENILWKYVVQQIKSLARVHAAGKVSTEKL